MSFFEGRTSDSPYIDSVWRGWTGENYAPVCPADEHWNVLFLRSGTTSTADVEGPLTKATAKFRAEPAEFLVIRFTLGVYMPYIPVGALLDHSAPPADTGGPSVWLGGAARQVPTFENAETYVDWLIRDGTLAHDPLVGEALREPIPEYSARTLRRRFQYATGLTQGAVRQIERARQAVALLGQGVPILDAAYEAGYADQPHMTRALRRYFGQTPAQIARATVP